MQNNIRTIIQAAAIVFLLQACAHGPYKGRVVDEITGEPVAGAVAVASWSDVHVNVGGGTSYCIDAAEAVTDGKGEFEILERRAPLFGTLGTMDIHIYKVGFQRVECMWRYLGEAGTCYAYKPVEFDGDRAVFPLRRVAKNRLHTEEGNYPSVCGRKDGKPLSALDEARKEYRRALGLKP